MGRAAAGVVLAISAALAAAAVVQAQVPPPFRCTIEAIEQGNSVTLTGVIQADVDVSGTYRLTASKTSGSASSKVNQSGVFRATPDAPARLGTVALSGSDPGFEARLFVALEGREVACAVRGGTPL
jgi:opacity protein-like surface antigen